MTRDEILNMPAGAEMDAMVATEVMGWEYIPKLTTYMRPDGLRNDGSLIPNYSTSISAAFEIVEKRTGKPWESAFEVNAVPVITKNWRAAFGAYRWAIAETLPMAICRAALLAVMDEK